MNGQPTANDPGRKDARGSPSCSNPPSHHQTSGTKADQDGQCANHRRPGRRPPAERWVRRSRSEPRDLPRPRSPASARSTNSRFRDSRSTKGKLYTGFPLFILLRAESLAAVRRGLDVSVVRRNRQFVSPLPGIIHTDTRMVANGPVGFDLATILKPEDSPKRQIAAIQAAVDIERSGQPPRPSINRPSHSTARRRIAAETLPAPSPRSTFHTCRNTRYT